MNSDDQVVLVHAVKNQRGQVGFFVESADTDAGPQLLGNCDDKKKQNIIEDAKKCFSEYKKVVESTNEKLKKNPVLQMYYKDNNTPCTKNGWNMNHHFARCNNMMFCPNPQNQVWYRFRTEGGRMFSGYQWNTTQSPQRSDAEKSCPQTDLGVQASMKEPLAYNLTFIPRHKKKKKKLPEIKVFVPSSDDEVKKRRKKKRTPVEDSEEETKQEQEVSPLKESRGSSDDEKKKRRRKKRTPVEDNEEETKEEKEVSPPRANRESPERKKIEPKKKKKEDRKKTLQEHLRANRPDFIERADKRSQCLADLAILRDLRKQKYFELLELTRKIRAKDMAAKERSRTRTRSEARARTRILRELESSTSISSSSSY